MTDHIHRGLARTLIISSKSKSERKNTSTLLCIFSGENTNTTKDFSLVVFSIGGNMRKVPSGRELSLQATEGERVTIKFA